MTYAEAEAYHLRAAAKLAGSPFATHQESQKHHLAEADRNRDAAFRTRFPHVLMPRGK